MFQPCHVKHSAFVFFVLVMVNNVKIFYVKFNVRVSEKESFLFFSKDQA